MDYNNILNYILIAIIFVIIYRIVLKYNDLSNEHFNQELIQDESVVDVPIVHEKDYIYKIGKDLEKEYDNIKPKSTDCRLREIDEEVETYIDKSLINKDVCPKIKQTTSEFHKDFFNFRDKTENNSSLVVDSVDKVLDLMLSGNLSQNRRYPNMKIKDIYDYSTAGPNLYERDCVRLPQFDNINNDGYGFKLGTSTTNMSLTRDNWTYKNENIINGGEIENGIYADDPSRNTHFPVF